MSTNKSESVVFIAGGAATGATIFNTVGGIGLVGSFGGVGLGVVPLMAAGGLTGAAVYGAIHGVNQGDSVALGALGMGAMAGAGLSATIGGVGLGMGGTAFGLGMGAMAFTGGIFGLGIYGLGKILINETRHESFADTYERMDAKVSSQEFYLEAMMELDPTLRELAFEQKMRELDIEDEFQQLKSKFGKVGNSSNNNNIFIQETIANQTVKSQFQELEIEEELRQLKKKIPDKNHNQKQEYIPNYELKTNNLVSKKWQNINNFTGHLKEINSFAVSQENLLVSVSNDKSIKVWDILTGKNIFNFFGLPQEIISVAISPDNQTIIVGDFDNKVTAFNLKTKSFVRTFFDNYYSPSPYSHKSVVMSVNFNSQGNEIISASADKTIKLWCSKTGLLKRTFNGHLGEVMSAVFSPDNSYIISGSRDKTIRIWPRNNCLNPPVILNGHLGAVNMVKITPDGEIIVSGSSDKTIKLWSLKSGKLLNTLIGHTDAIFYLNISPDGQFLVSGSADNTVKIWSLQTGELIDNLDGKYPVIFTQDSQYLITNSNNNVIKIWQKLAYSVSENYPININGNWWEILGVSFNASVSEIKTARNKLVKKYHPDYYHNQEEAKIIMQAINQAYQRSIDQLIK